MREFFKKRFNSRILAFSLCLMLVASLLPAVPAFAENEGLGSRKNPIVLDLANAPLILGGDQYFGELYYRITGTLDAENYTVTGNNQPVIHIGTDFTAHVELYNVNIDLSKLPKDEYCTQAIRSSVLEFDVNDKRAIEITGNNVIIGDTNMGYNTERAAVYLQQTDLIGGGTLNIKSVTRALETSGYDASDEGDRVQSIDGVTIIAESEEADALWLNPMQGLLKITNADITAVGTDPNVTDGELSFTHAGIAFYGGDRTELSSVLIEDSTIKSSGENGMQLYYSDIEINNSDVEASAIDITFPRSENAGGDGIYFYENRANLTIGEGSTVTATGGDQMSERTGVSSFVAGNGVRIGDYPSIPGNNGTYSNLTIEKGGELIARSGGRLETVAPLSHASTGGARVYSGMAAKLANITVDGNLEVYGANHPILGGTGLLLQYSHINVGGTGSIYAKGGDMTAPGTDSAAFGALVFEDAFHLKDLTDVDPAIRTSSMTKADGAKVTIVSGLNSKREFPAAYIDIDVSGTSRSDVFNGYQPINGWADGSVPSQQLPAPEKDETTPEYNLDGTLSSWAEAEVSRAVELNLVPEHLQSKYTQAITRLEFAQLAVRYYETVTGTAITGRKQFNDTSSADVQKAAYIGVTNGIDDNNFGPNMTLTREQAAAMLSRLADAAGTALTKNSGSFADMGSVSGYASEAVGQMQETGIMNGVGGNRFDPKGVYTREQSIATMLRMYDY